jgi:hypothetical protein
MYVSGYNALLYTVVRKLVSLIPWLYRIPQSKLAKLASAWQQLAYRYINLI